MNRRTFIFTASMAALATSVASNSVALARAFTGGKKGVAIKGYDPVAYFTQGKPVKGSAEFTTSWNGVTMQFATAADRDLFKSNPEKYAPQYGGYCAFAAAKGQLAPTTPDAFSIVGDKLYLNYSKGIRSKWQANQTKFIKDADKNWPKLK